MTRRRLFIGLGLGVVLLLLGYLAAWWETGPSEKERAYQRIEHGMTRSEVEGIIGQPAGDYSDPVFRASRKSHLALARHSGPPLSQSLEPEVSLELWVWDQVGIGVAFDRDEKAVGCYLFKLSDSPRSVIDRVRKFLGI